MASELDPNLLISALDAMRDFVIIKGPKSRLVWANKSFRDYYGMSQEDLEGIIDGPQSDPDDTLQYVRDDALVFSSGSHVEVSSEVVTDHSGESRLFQTIKSPILDEGRVAYSVGVSRRHDDGELLPGSPHLEAKALTKPLRLLSTVFPLALLVTDPGGLVVAASPSWIDTFGGIGAGPDSHASDLPACLRDVTLAIDQASASATSSAVRTPVETIDADAVFEFRVGPWTYDDGSPGGVLVVAFDVTAESASKAQIEEANERYRHVLEGASVGIWDWLDVNDNEEYWSERFYKLLGYRAGEIEASLDAFRDLVHPDDIERTFAAVDAHFQHGEPFEIEYRLRTKPGSYRWFMGHGVVARDNCGNPTRMVGSIQDIDGRVRAQQTLERANEDLEHFAHVAAHDLREPARRQRMLIDLIIDEHGDALPDGARRDLQLVKDQSEAMLAMITGFRALTGFDGATLERSEIALSDLARSMVDEILPGSTATANIDLPASVGGYPAIVEILLRNLISNSAKHGTAPLTVDISHEIRADGLVWYIVANRWDGDPNRVTNDIFKPFVGAGQTAGSGLGLSICKRAVQHHQGTIMAEPEPGTFKIAFNLGERT